MKKNRFVPIVLSFVVGFLLMSGCRHPLLEKTEISGAPGQGLLLVSLSGDHVGQSLAARTMLPLNPEFTRYELQFDAPAGREPYSFYNSTMQLHLEAGTYTITAKGYVGDTATAQSDPQRVTVTNEGLAAVEFVLRPFMEPSVNGLLCYALNWEGLSRMPDRAELLIETYSDGKPIPISLIPGDLSAGSDPGTILLLQKDIALVKLTGSLPLPPGEYRLTMTVTMDDFDEPVSRMDIAHIYSNLTTAGSFYYGSGDLIISNIGVDSGSGFITRFTFSETPSATTVIGSIPGTDGTRLIMVMVPNETDLKNLTPIVETAPGAAISSPLPATPPLGDGTPPAYIKGEIDFSNPTVWTAIDKRGVSQEYTVVVSKAPVPPGDKKITHFFFKEFPGAAALIDQNAGTIGVVVPNGTKAANSAYNLTPVISIIGNRVVQYSIDDDAEYDLAGTPLEFADGQIFRVYADGDPNPKSYAVLVTEALNSEAEITGFVIDGYPNVPVSIAPGPNGGYYPITATLPYGVPLTNLIPLIQYKGKSLDPASGAGQNFDVPVFYTVRSWDDTNTKIYRATITNEPADRNTGIFDFVITNVPNSKVVIGQNPRPDGKIPIVVQVPYGTNERNLIPAITLKSPSATISPASGIAIPFVNQEAVYTVTAQDTTATQQYVVVVSQDVQYYYVNGTTGSDDWPDIYNGGSETSPFKTLAYAVYRASQHSTVNKIFVSGALTDNTEAGAWEDAAVPWSGGFHPSGGDSGSVFNLIGTNGKRITVTGGGSDAALRGTSGKRVLSVTGGADLVFENITITGGNNPPVASYGGNGGGIYIGGSSKVKFSGGSGNGITGNTARSGGGVYVSDDSVNEDYDFTLLNGSISNNTATGTSTTAGALAGGGGIYVNNYALAWLAGGTISGNNASGGSGGGALVNGSTQNPSGPTGDEYGLLMSGGSISNNNSGGSVSPHGGGGVYVAKGVFEMLGGTITANNSTRQGGGVFIAYNSRFTASGYSSITNNTGVGSSKAICNRGYTEMRGNAQADKVYVWISEQSVFSRGNAFNIAENARIGGIVLAYSEYPGGNLNKIYIAGLTGTDQVCLIDFEMHLINNYTSFALTDINDWLGKKVIENGNNVVPVARFPLNTLVGKTTVLLSDYTLNDKGELIRKP